MEWFERKTSVAGFQISNWIIVLGAIIIVLLIFQITGTSTVSRLRLLGAY
jgi:hypothetical protein